MNELQAAWDKRLKMRAEAEKIYETANKQWLEAVLASELIKSCGKVNVKWEWNGKAVNYRIGDNLYIDNGDNQNE